MAKEGNEYGDFSTSQFSPPPKRSGFGGYSVRATLCALGVALIFLVACGAPEATQFLPRGNSTISLQTASGTIPVRVEVMDSEAEWQRGMMSREQLAEDAGMLFAFPDSKVRKFWMKDTLVPLDMLFFDADLQLIHIQHSAPPFKRDPCPTFGPEKSAQYVLEVNAEWTKEHDVTLGDRLR